MSKEYLSLSASPVELFSDCWREPGAILADSDPAEEYRECLAKAAAFFRALGLDDAALTLDA